MKRLLALVLSAAMFFFTGMPAARPQIRPTTARRPTADAGGEGGYTIVTNNFGVGAYPLI